MGSGDIAPPVPPFLNSALEGGEWSVSRLYIYTSREGGFGIYLIGGWVGSRAGLKAVGIENFLPQMKSNPGNPVRS
jgi:hypothetical protein